MTGDVLVVGATGTVGPHVVASLAARRVPVRVLTRDPLRARTLLPEGVDIRSGDPGDEDTLAAAADGAAALFLLTAHSRDMAEQQLRIIRAVRRNDIRIVKVSGTSTAITPGGPYACRQHWEVEQVLAGTGKPYVILRPNAFMQTLIDRIMLPGARATGTIANPIAGAGISLIDARDVGACAATVLTDPRWDGRTLVLTGPEPVTYHRIGELLGVPVRDITPGDVRRDLEGRGVPPWEAEHFQEMYQLFRDGGSQFVTGDVQELLGRPPGTVADHFATVSRVTQGDPQT